MSNLPAITDPGSLVTLAPLSQNPAAIYLASLTSAHSKRTMRAALGHHRRHDQRWAAQRRDAALGNAALSTHGGYPGSPGGTLQVHHGQQDVVSAAGCTEGRLQARHDIPDEYAKASDISGIKDNPSRLAATCPGGKSQHWPRPVQLI